MLSLDSLNKCARGHWQRWILQEWMEGKEVQSPVTGLRGKAKKYNGRYWNSFQNLLARVRNAGFLMVNNYDSDREYLNNIRRTATRQHSISPGTS